jgi:hypothetical protein
MGRYGNWTIEPSNRASSLDVRFLPLTLDGMQRLEKSPDAPATPLTRTV